jgi:hypothetical protein
MHPQSVYQTVLNIIKREGVLGLYSGLSSSLLGIAVTNGYWVTVTIELDAKADP